MTSRPLHAVLLPHDAAARRLLELLPGALDGSGPALAPLDPGLPPARLAQVIATLAPDTLETSEGVRHLTRLGGGGGAAGRTPGRTAQVAAVISTSGSTGAPKGVALSAGALLASARASLRRITGSPAGQDGGQPEHGGPGRAGGTGQPGRWLCCLPVHHISGFGVLVRSVVAGTEPVVADRAGPQEVSSAIAAGCQYASLVPTQLGRLLDREAPLDGLRTILLGGTMIPAGMVERASAAGVRVVTTYGMTETSGGCVYDGLPLDGVRVTSDPRGRIAIAGPVLFSGYLAGAGRAAAAFTDGWFVTADLGGPGPDGLLRVLGRADDVIVTGGEKVVAAQVEQALRECPDVGDVIVVGVPDPVWGEVVTAVVSPAGDGAVPGLAGLRELVSSVLPRYAAPRALHLVDAIPLLPTGKPDRQRARHLASGRG